MQEITASVKCWLQHSQSYYAVLISEKRIRLMIASVTLLCIFFSVVVTHAGVAQWLLEDAIDNSIVLRDNYNYMASDDAPPPSNNTYHLTMPMMMQDYIIADIFSQLDSGLKMSLEPNFVRTEKIKMWGEEEREEAGDDFSQFVTDRPPKVILG